MPTSRAAIRPTGSQGRWPWAARVNSAPRTHGLVGQRVEEGARAGGAVPAGDVAVEPVAGGEEEADDDVDPGRAPGHEHEDVHRGGQEARHGDRVGRGGQRARAERVAGVLGAASLTGSSAPALRQRASTGTADRSGPSAPMRATSTRRPTARSTGRWTMPSISGASCTVRPRPGASTSTWRVLADERVALGGRDGVLELGALAQALEGELGRAPGRAGRRRGCRPRWRR